MTRNGRLGLDITYNNLNLPQKVAYHSKTQNDSVEYVYSAAGEKLAKKYNGKFIEYYEGSVVYGEDKKPKYILHLEGMVRKDSTNNWLYQFNVTDHLGNVRVVVDENRNVLQHTDYFPFGLAVNTNNLNINKYLYNGKELQDEVLGGKPLDWLDYGARNYDATLGRWSNIDPLAEKYFSYSPYNYVLNNPLRYIDPDGEDVYLYYYVNNHQEDPQDDAMFWQSAITRARDMLSNGQIGDGDIYKIVEISDLGNLKESVEANIAELSSTYGNGRIWTLVTWGS